ncbi:MAG: hypothetical protein BZ151_02455 [Desulfobacca sp. 4484_104]|nr:MAG: hypothetical protein BZ151_02455 [Desulfobacca sp. 4484_104]
MVARQGMQDDGRHMDSQKYGDQRCPKLMEFLDEVNDWVASWLKECGDRRKQVVAVPRYRAPSGQNGLGLDHKSHERGGLR